MTSAERDRHAGSAEERRKALRSEVLGGLFERVLLSSKVGAVRVAVSLAFVICDWITDHPEIDEAAVADLADRLSRRGRRQGAGA